MTPDVEPWTRAVLPVASATAVSGATPPSDARWAIEPQDPERHDARSPTARRCRGSRGRARRASRRGPSAWSAARHVAAVDDLDRHAGSPTSASMSASGSDVVPPLMWPTMSGAPRGRRPRRSRSSPRSTGRRCGTSTIIPCVRAQATIGAASAPVLTEPSPISPMSVTPAGGHLGEVVLLEPELEDRGAGADLHARGPDVRVRPLRDDRERLEPDDVLRAARAGGPRPPRSPSSRRRGAPTR